MGNVSPLDSDGRFEDILSKNKITGNIIKVQNKTKQKE